MIPSITNCVFGILIKDQKVLLVKNLYKEFGPIWGIPGGKQKPNESVHNTLIREFKEEVSLDIHLGSQVTLFERMQPNRPFHLLAPVFAVLSTQEPKIKINDTVVEYKFFSITELKKDPQTIMNRLQLIQYLEDPSKLAPYVFLPPELDLGPLDN